MTTAIARLDANFASESVKGTFDWYDMAHMPAEGLGWPGQAPGPFGRLPAKAKGVVRDPVWHLGQMSAGVAFRFVTDSPSLVVSWDLTGAALAMPHMPATGMSGVDLYVRADGRWRWAGNTKPAGEKHIDTFTYPLITEVGVKEREYLMYLPLYNITAALRLGVVPGHTLKAALPRPADKAKPMCFYGTSILQGGCASRPGMAYPSIIGRMLDRAHINLGFSGNGRMEPEVADLMAELDPSIYVLDPLPNNQKADIEERGENLITTLRKARPKTPILMVESITYQDGHLVPSRYNRYTTSNAAWKVIYDKLIAQGDTNLHYIPGDDLLGDDDEGTVDGTHCTDLGFWRMAQVIGPVVDDILRK